jgi:hypothetical protein
VFFPLGRSYELPVTLFIGLHFSQMGLIGLWAGLGGSPLWLRSTGSLVGLFYLWLILCFAVGFFLWENAILVAASTMTVAVLLFCVRWRGWTVRHPSSLPPSRIEFQFSIRHLMLLTLAVAIILAIGRWVGVKSFRFSLDLWTAILLFSVTIAFLTLVSIWGTLGEPRWLVRGGVTLAAGLAIGFGIDRFFGETRPWFYTIAILILTISLTVSLLVVRSCGYRLVRVRRTRIPSTQSLPPN